MDTGINFHHYLKNNLQAYPHRRYKKRIHTTQPRNNMNPQKYILYFQTNFFEFLFNNKISIEDLKNERINEEMWARIDAIEADYYKKLYEDQIQAYADWSSNYYLAI
jgi:hypothetical protein